MKVSLRHKLPMRIIGVRRAKTKNMLVWSSDHSWTSRQVQSLNLYDYMKLVNQPKFVCFVFFDFCCGCLWVFLIKNERISGIFIDINLSLACEIYLEWTLIYCTSISIQYFYTSAPFTVSYAKIRWTYSEIDNKRNKRQWWQPTSTPFFFSPTKQNCVHHN